MTLSFLTPTRTVLSITDEALYIYSSGAKGVSLVEAVPWDSEGFERNVVEVVLKECGRKPLLILNDMVEQHYRKERIIKGRVGIFDHANLIERKLNAAFSNYPIRASYPLKEKVRSKDGKGADDVYIFAAVPAAEQVAQTLSVAKGTYAEISGFCLLPVEASGMVKELSKKLAKNKKEQSRWVIFIGQHKNGGLRQIVIKDGELALTRMTPITNSVSNIDNWAAEVHHEYKATMSYLSRFGYQAEDGVDVILVSESDAGTALEKLIEEECNYTSMTLNEAARILNLAVGLQEDGHYADPLHIAWIGQKSRFMLPMKSPQIEEIIKPRRMATYGMALLLLLSAFLIYQSWNGYQQRTILQQEYNLSKQEKVQLDVQYQKEVERKESLGIDVRLVQGAIAVYDELEENRIKVFETLKAVGYALGRDLRTDEFNVRRPKKQDEFSVGFDDFNRTEKPKIALFDVVMRMSYPATTDIDKGNQEVRDLRQKIQMMLPSHSVKVSKFLKDYEYVQDVIVESGDLEKEHIQQDFVAEITITGWQQND